MAYAIEAKCVGGREPIEVIIERYQPQLQWIMFVTETDQCAISIISGAAEPIVEWIPRSQEYIDEMVNRGKQFMDCVAKRIPPVALPEVPAPIDASKVYDMSANNRWVTSAVDWLDTKEAAAVCKDAEKILKSCVPADAKKCFGADIQITRDRAGRLSLREET